MLSPRSVLILAAKEMRDARRNRWFIVIASLFAILSLALSLLGLSGMGNLGVAGFGRTAASLLNLVLLIVPLMGLLLGATSVAAEREHGTLATLLAQPVTLREILLGKYMGCAMALTTAVLLGFGASGLVIGRYGGAGQISDYLLLAALTVMLGLASLSVGFCISVGARRMPIAMGMAIFAWFAFTFLSDVGLMGGAMALKISGPALFWLVAANPAQAFKLFMVSRLQKSFESFGAAGIMASDVFGPWLLPALAGIILAWALLSLLAAFVLFRHRCAE